MFGAVSPAAAQVAPRSFDTLSNTRCGVASASGSRESGSRNGIANVRCFVRTSFGIPAASASVSARTPVSEASGSTSSIDTMNGTGGHGLRARPVERVWRYAGGADAAMTRSIGSPGASKSLIFSRIGPSGPNPPASRTCLRRHDQCPPGRWAAGPAIWGISAGPRRANPAILLADRWFQLRRSDCS